jgi:chromosomal replication initiator protein
MSLKTIEPQKLWEDILKRLEEELPVPAFESWIKPVKFITVEDNKLVISTNSKMGKEWVFKHYLALFKKILFDLTQESMDLKIIVEKLEKNNNTESQNPEEARKNSNIPLSELQVDALRIVSNNLNLKYTFETFVVGTHNKFPQAAAFAVAKSPAKAHNPLFIYGGAGLGKTHLMQAIGHYILFHHKGLKVKYTSTEMFTNDLINSLRIGNDKMQAFRSKYRQIDVLLIDDIQFIEGKENTQEEIFHTFNTLYESGKQIVLTSDRHPKNISTLTERLRSRFEWGLLADIQVPDLETRIAILRNKAERDQLLVGDDVLELIASAYQNNIRELEGALNRVIAYSSINNQLLTTDTVKNIINISGSTKNLSIEKIIETTAVYFSIEASEIKGQSRSKEISHARQVAIYLTRDMTSSSFPAIGHAFGGRKHTTILYSYEKMKEEIETNKVLAETISSISKLITSSGQKA